MAPGQENHQNITFSTPLIIYKYERSGYNCHLSSDCNDLVKLARLALRAKPGNEEQLVAVFEEQLEHILKTMTGVGKGGSLEQGARHFLSARH